MSLLCHCHYLGLPNADMEYEHLLALLSLQSSSIAFPGCLQWVQYHVQVLSYLDIPNQY